MRISRMVACAALALAATGASAQTADERIAGLVAAWIADEGADLPEVVKSYGAACVTPILVAMAEPAKQVIVAAAGLPAGIEALAVGDPPAHAAMYPAFVECVETMLLGEPIVAFVDGEARRATPEERAVIQVCIMDAVRGLSSEAKQIIARAAEFEDGAQQLIRGRPDLAGTLDARLEVCF